MSKKELTSGFSWNTLTVVLQVVIQLAYTGMLARLVTRDSFMLMGIVLSIMGFAEIFSQVGVGPALVQRKEVHQQHMNGAFYTALILGVGFTLLFVAAAPFIANFYELPELRSIVSVVSLSFTISAVAVVPRSMMTKHLRFRTMFKASMISIIGGNVVVGLGLAYLGWNVWAYVWALFTQNALMTIALWYYEPVKLTWKWEWKYTRELIRYGAGSTLFNALNYLATKVDVMLIPRFLRGSAVQLSDYDKMQASYYERSNYAMSQPVTVMGKLSDSVLFSGMSRMQDETEKLRKTILIATNMLACVIIPASVFVSFFAEDILRIWLGPDYTDAAVILQILFYAGIFRSLSKLGDSLLRARNAVFKGSWFKAIYVILMIVGIYITIPFGMNWVAFSIVLTTFIHYLMSLYMCTQLIQVSWESLSNALLPSLKLAILTGISSSLVLFLQMWLDMPALILLLVAIVVVFGSLGLSLYFFPKQLGNRDINALYHLPEKLKKIPLVRKMFGRLGTV